MAHLAVASPCWIGLRLFNESVEAKVRVAQGGPRQECAGPLFPTNSKRLLID